MVAISKRLVSALCSILLGALSFSSAHSQNPTLEDEYWSIVGRADSWAMEGWLVRAWAKGTQAGWEDHARIPLLATPGCMMTAAAGNVGRFLECFAWAELALRYNPTSHTALSFAHGLAATRHMLFGQTQKALDEFAHLETHYELHGQATATWGYTLFSQGRKLARSLALLDDCRNPLCSFESPLAPFTPVGTLLNLAEIQHMAGDAAASQATLARARAKAREMNFPYLERIESYPIWFERNTRIRSLGGPAVGDVGLPLPALMGKQACANCHVGAVTNEPEDVPFKSGIP